MDIFLERAKDEDAKHIYEMQKESFRELLEKYEDHETSPASEPLSKTVEKLKSESTYFYFIKSDGETVGAIRVVDNKEKSTPKRISPLFVLPKYRRRGIAKATITEVERIHGSSNWTLETILEEEGNCHLYEKMGYIKSKERKVVNDKMTLVVYRK